MKKVRYKIINESNNSLDSFKSRKEAMDFMPKMKEGMKWRIVQYYEDERFTY